MNAPVVVWKRNDLRIVAVDKVDEMADDIPLLMLERRRFDLLNNESWRIIHTCDDSGASDAVIDLVQLIVSDIDMMPKWVRNFVSESQALYDAATGNGNTGGKGGAA